eukprot:2275061-Rhodomonas_salina.1
MAATESPYDPMECRMGQTWSVGTITPHIFMIAAAIALPPSGSRSPPSLSSSPPRTRRGRGHTRARRNLVLLAGRRPGWSPGWGFHSHRLQLREQILWPGMSCSHSAPLRVTASQRDT